MIFSDPMTDHKQPYQTDALLKGLKALLTSLPTEEEKRELLRVLSETRSFIEEMQLLVEAFPTVESSRDLSEGLSRLNALTQRAHNDKGLRKLLGLKGVSTSSKSKMSTTSDGVKSRARKLEQQLHHRDGSDFAELLEQSGEPLSVLTELAASLGMRTISRERKASLIKRIATHVENQRGYSLLRGEGSVSLDGKRISSNGNP